jgi:hypothetical protein
MSYLADFEQNLRAMLVSEEVDLEAVVAFVKQTVLQSYRNGLKGARGASQASGRGSALAAGKLKPAKQPVQSSQEDDLPF